MLNHVTMLIAAGVCWGYVSVCVCQPIAAAWFHVYINVHLKISDETRVNMGVKSLE